jgi:poly-gamma-glutamate biosynthesis protein PgsC/CapC
MLVETVGLGMVASYFLTETVGLAAGGIVVPGYFALTLTDPVRVIATILVALAVYALLKVLDKVIVLYGRRLMLVSVLVGYLLGYLTRIVPPLALNGGTVDISVIGYAMPGLFAYWLHRQGVVETISMMLVAAVLTRLAVTVVSGGAF